jgi:CheY-like chemotaxis protein
MTTILVIEDNHDNMDLIEEILEDEGFSVLKAYLAEEGIALLKENAVKLIIIDISLPKMSGLKATEIIKAERASRDIPIIALTAHARDSDKDAALSAGCSGFLTKPIDEDKLLEMIKNLL